jgi:3-deoxy-D-manno-octulosonic-acid transferase
MNFITFSLSRLLWPFLQMRGEPTAWKLRWELTGLNLTPVDLWIHSASLGEISPFFPMMETISSSKRIAVTITSGRSLDAVRKRLNGKAEVIPLPIEGGPGMAHLFKILRPKRLIVLESELWPIMIRTAFEEKIPVSFLGARTRGLKNLLWRWLIHSRDHLPYIEEIWVSTKEEKEKFFKLGVPLEKIHHGFHPKLLTPPPPPLPQAFSNFLKLSQPVIIAGSIHIEELEFLKSIYRSLKPIFPGLSVILVPRYPREGNLFVESFRASGEMPGIWPDLKPITILDRFGVLPSLYGLGQVALVGGAWVPLGGHNPVEPLYHGVPVVLGPHHHHLADLLPLLPQNSIHITKGVESALETIRSLIKDPPRDRSGWKDILLEERKKTEALIQRFFTTP